MNTVLYEKGESTFAIIQTIIFSGRLREVKNLSTKAAALARINNVMNGHFGDHKSIGNGLYEM